MPHFSTETKIIIFRHGLYKVKCEEFKLPKSHSYIYIYISFKSDSIYDSMSLGCTERSLKGLAIGQNIKKVQEYFLVVASVNNEQIIWDLLAHLRQDRVTHQGLALQHFPWRLMAVFWYCQDPPIPRRATDGCNADCVCLFVQEAFDCVSPEGLFLNF